MSSETLRAVLEFLYSGTIFFENDELDVDLAFELVIRGQELDFKRYPSPNQQN